MEKELKNRKEDKFDHAFIKDIQICAFSFIILVVYVSLYSFLTPMLGESVTNFLFLIVGVAVGPAAFYFFVTRLIRIFGWLFKKENWIDFGD